VKSHLVEVWLPVPVLMQKSWNSLLPHLKVFRFSVTPAMSTDQHWEIQTSFGKSVSSIRFGQWICRWFL